MNIYKYVLVPFKHRASMVKFMVTLLCVLFNNYYKVSAQDIYRNEEGHIQLMTLLEDKPLKAESHKLAYYLDYSTKQLNGVLDLKTLSIDNSEIMTILKEKEEPLILRFSGSVPSIDFLSKEHDPISFNWLVSITYNNNTYKARFKATITHIYLNSLMSCVISASGQILVSDTGLDKVIPGLDKTLEVQFTQTVLKLK